MRDIKEAGGGGGGGTRLGWRVTLITHTMNSECYITGCGTDVVFRGGFPVAGDSQLEVSINAGEDKTIVILASSLHG